MVKLVLGQILLKHIGDHLFGQQDEMRHLQLDVAVADMDFEAWFSIHPSKFPIRSTTVVVAILELRFPVERSWFIAGV